MAQIRVFPVKTASASPTKRPIWPYALKDSLIAHNTIVGSVPAANGDYALLVSPGENVRVFNNIVLGTRLAVSGQGVQARNNLVQDLGKLASWNGAVVSGSLFGDPGFTLGSGFDPDSYRLTPSSQARAAGAEVIEVRKDYFGQPRLPGVAPDVGAIQAPQPQRLHRVSTSGSV